MVRIGIVLALLFLVIAARLISVGIEKSEAAVLKDAYIDDGCKTGTSADGLFFAEGDPSAYQVRNGSGYNNCHLTMIAFWPGSNYAEWYLPVNDPAYQGNYSNNAYVGSPVAPRTVRAKYRVFPNGHCCGTTDKYFLNQVVNNGGFCYKLGDEPYGNGGTMRVIKRTTAAEKDTTTFIVIDLFCFVRP